MLNSLVVLIVGANKEFSCSSAKGTIKEQEGSDSEWGVRNGPNSPLLPPRRSLPSLERKLKLHERGWDDVTTVMVGYGDNIVQGSAKRSEDFVKQQPGRVRQKS